MKRTRILTAVLLVIALSAVPIAGQAETIVRMYCIDDLDIESSPPPGYEDSSWNPGNWKKYLKNQYVLCNGYYVMLSMDPPNYEPWADWNYESTGFYDLWLEYLSDENSPLEEDILDVATFDFSQTPKDTSFPDCEVLEGDYAYLYYWLATLRGTLLMWENWIFDTYYPPPNYDLSEDPWVTEEGLSEEYVYNKRHYRSYGYGDLWVEFFSSNPTVEIINAE